MWFRANFVDGSLWAITDVAAAASSPGDGMIAVTGVPAGVNAEAVRALLYAALGIPLGEGGGAFKFSIPYFNLIAPNAVPVGWISLPVNPVAATTITLNGTAWTFVTSGAVGPQTNIGANAAATMTTLVTNLNATADAQVAKYLCRVVWDDFANHQQNCRTYEQRIYAGDERCWRLRVSRRHDRRRDVCQSCRVHCSITSKGWRRGFKFSRIVVSG
jgi:hypothetical protein